MADDTIHDDIREIRQALTTLVAGQATAATKIDGLNTRLFEAGTGALPVLFKRVGELDDDVAANKAASAAACLVCSNEIKVVAATVKEQKIYVSGIALGVTLALNVVKAGLGKLFHF